MKGYMYILECSDGTYYTGSTIDLERRVAEHSGHLDTLPVVSIRGFAATRQPSECQPLAEEVVSIRGFAATRQPSECQPLAECSERNEECTETTVKKMTEQRFHEGRGANYTKNRRPVKLVYYEEYSRIDEAFYREKQVQKWSHAKKKALIENRSHDLPLLAKKEFSKRLSRYAASPLLDNRTEKN